MNAELLAGLRELAERRVPCDGEFHKTTHHEHQRCGRYQCVDGTIPDPRFAALRGKHWWEEHGRAYRLGLDDDEGQPIFKCANCGQENNKADDYCLRTDAGALDAVVFAHGWAVTKFPAGHVSVETAGGIDLLTFCDTYDTSIENLASALIEATKAP